MGTTFFTELSATHPLPPRWSAPRVIADEVRIGDTPIRRVGLASTETTGIEVTGSAAGLGERPLSRAWFELLERTAVVEAQERPCPLRDAQGQMVGAVPSGTQDRVRPGRRWARSNGVALHRTWAEACERAHLELVERDRVLRAWFGELSAHPAPAPDVVTRLATHEWKAALVPTDGRSHDTVAVAVVVGFPLAPSRPLARGFAARRTPRAALEAAGAEAVQGLAFLWDEPLPRETPAPYPSPLFHLDYYLRPEQHGKLRAWLSGDWPEVPHRDAALDGSEPIVFADLTPPGCNLFVARALSGRAAELVFGRCPAPVALSVPPELHVHPIP